MKFLSRFVVYLVIALGFEAARGGAYDDFFHALALDNARTVSTLLERGFDPNSPDEQGNPALFAALRADAFKVAEVLIARSQTQVDAANAHDETPVMLAALKGRVDLVQKLLARGARPDREGWTPLHYAASGPEPRAVALLLERGARVDALSPNRSTPLMMAARYGAEGAVEALLARGADTKLRNDRGLGPADFARLGGREALAAKLERLGG